VEASGDVALAAENAFALYMGLFRMRLSCAVLQKMSALPALVAQGGPA
jgi:hypothetical protein